MTSASASRVTRSRRSLRARDRGRRWAASSPRHARSRARRNVADRRAAAPAPRRTRRAANAGRATAPAAAAARGRERRPPPQADAAPAAEPTPARRASRTRTFRTHREGARRLRRVVPGRHLTTESPDAWPGPNTRAPSELVFSVFALIIIAIVVHAAVRHGRAAAGERGARGADAAAMQKDPNYVAGALALRACSRTTSRSPSHPRALGARDHGLQDLRMRARARAARARPGARARRA